MIGYTLEIKDSLGNDMLGGPVLVFDARRHDGTTLSMMYHGHIEEITDTLHPDILVDLHVKGIDSRNLNVFNDCYLTEIVRDESGSCFYWQFSHSEVEAYLPPELRIKKPEGLPSGSWKQLGF